MPDQLDQLRVFVASPGDVHRERDEVARVLERLNCILERIAKVRFRLIRWESDTFPGVGADAQDVINSQIPEDYEIFLGIMWRRIGSPTRRAESGTVEEYERARKRFDNDPNSVQIMWYFKDQTAPSAKAGPKGQVRMVKAFRERLRHTGVYDASFRSTVKFRELVDKHLINFVCDWIDRRDNIIREHGVDWSPAEIQDLVQFVYSEMQLFTDSGVRLSMAYRRLAGGIDELSTRAGRLLKDVFDEAAHAVLRNAIEQLRVELAEFTNHIRNLAPALGQHFNQSARGVIQLLALSSKTQLPAATFGFAFMRHQVAQFHSCVTEGVQLQRVVQEKMSEYTLSDPNFNATRLEALKALDLLIVEYQSILAANGALLDVIDRIVGTGD